MLIAEELEVGLDQITVQAAPPDTSSFTSTRLLGDQATGGSASIRAGWQWACAKPAPSAARC